MSKMTYFGTLQHMTNTLDLIVILTAEKVSKLYCKYSMGSMYYQHYILEASQKADCLRPSAEFTSVTANIYGCVNIV